MQTLIARVFTAPSTYPVLKGRRLNLVYLYYSFLRIQDSASEDQLQVCLHLLIEGLTIFISKGFTLDVYHMKFLVGLTERFWCSPSVAILAATYLGLTSVATGGEFVGSPFLLSKWLDLHFSRIDPAKSNFIEERVCLLSSAPVACSMQFGCKH